MTRNILIFLGTFAAGALIALITRAALHDPHAGHEAHVASTPTPAPMVANALVAPPPAPEAKAHAHHAAAPAPQPPADRAIPVNTLCAICGMDVGPGSVTAEYQGKTIGFGCAGCLPRFKADPDKYGPHYLRNEVMAP